MSLEMKYFVLKPKSRDRDCPYAQASRAALLTYAKEIEHADANLAEDIKTWVLGMTLTSAGAFPD